MSIFEQLGKEAADEFASNGTPNLLKNTLIGGGLGGVAGGLYGLINPGKSKNRLIAALKKGLIGAGLGGAGGYTLSAFSKKPHKQENEGNNAKPVHETWEKNKGPADRAIYKETDRLIALLNKAPRKAFDKYFFPPPNLQASLDGFVMSPEDEKYYNDQMSREHTKKHVDNLSNTLHKNMDRAPINPYLRIPEGASESKLRGYRSYWPYHDDKRYVDSYEPIRNLPRYAPLAESILNNNAMSALPRTYWDERLVGILEDMAKPEKERLGSYKDK